MLQKGWIGDATNEQRRDTTDDVTDCSFRTDWSAMKRGASVSEENTKKARPEAPAAAEEATLKYSTELEQLSLVQDEIEKLNAEADEEKLLDTLRRAHHAEVFRTLVRDVEGELSVEEVADDLSALADAMLDTDVELSVVPLGLVDQIVEWVADHAPARPTATFVPSPLMDGVSLVMVVVTLAVSVVSSFRSAVSVI